jgi:hypothetical protein
MKQILHVFVKDARRFWAEIAISLAITGIFTYIYPHQWRDVNLMHRAVMFNLAAAGGMMGILAQVLVVLVPLSWWLLISRVIHAEKLVGDRQFWLTRPYEWKKLLAAKVLFLVVFLYLPILIAHVVLLLEAGLHPLDYVPGLLYNLLLITGVIVLPLVTLASLTPTFAKMTLAILGVVLLVAGIAALGSLLPSDTTGSVPSPLGDKLSTVVLFSLCGVVVVLQYALRRARLGWGLLMAIPAFLSVLAFGDPDQLLMNRTYPRPASGTAAPVQLQYVPDFAHQASTNTTNDPQELEINFPLHASGVADGYTAIIEAVKATIDAPDGSHWDSPWQAVYNERLRPDTNDAAVRFRIRRSVYEKFKSTPVKLNLRFALTSARTDSITQIQVPAHDFFVSGFGVCSPHVGWLQEPLGITAISCRAALRQPMLSYVSALWSDKPCSPSQSGPFTGVLGTAWAGSLETRPADFGISSVWETPLSFSNSWAAYSQGSVPMPRHLCAGSPLTFTQYRLAGHIQTDLTLEDFHLPGLDIGSTLLFMTR